MDPGSCVPNCPKKYRTSNMTSLYRHQTSCKAYLAYQAEGNQLRAERISRKAEEEGSSSTSRRGHGVRANQPVQPQGDAGTSGDGHVGASRGSQSVHWQTTSPLPSGSSVDMAMPAGASEDPLYDATPFGVTETRSPELLSPPNIGDSTIPPGSPPPAPEPPLDQPPRRSHRRPRQVDDYLPEPLPALEEAGQSHSVIRRIRLIVRDTLRTAANSLGLSRSYRTRPTFDPDSFVLPEDLAKTSPLYNLVDSQSEKNDKTYTLKNKSQAALSTWQHSGSTQKSNEEVQKLVDVLLDPNFKTGGTEGV
ncbi:hypothetical protein FA13DRAFT_1797235 [Coprinellus micaceus]|uniref:Uncharacterized protein n=1 Tax=Coprinellus micaceus TaxID=71717 RepID=A0A4Y7STC4_COPMI|nr:hypothetical protein FA13DRAFT_1797235 [Coprinellus micaceus]